MTFVFQPLQAFGILFLALGFKGATRTIATHPATLLTPVFTFWTFGPAKSGGCAYRRNEKEICISFQLTWVNALLTTASSLVLSLICQYSFPIDPEALHNPDPVQPFMLNSTLGYFFLITLPLYANAVIFLFLIQFLNFKRSKWLPPILVPAAVALFVFPVALLQTQEGEMLLECFNGDEFCNSSLYNQWTSPSNNTHYSIFLLPSFSQVAHIPTAIVAVTFAIVCCITFIGHKCCRESYENNCFPMIQKIKYDTSLDFFVRLK